MYSCNVPWDGRGPGGHRLFFQSDGTLLFTSEPRPDSWIGLFFLRMALFFFETIVVKTDLDIFLLLWGLEPMELTNWTLQCYNTIRNPHRHDNRWLDGF